MNAQTNAARLLLWLLLWLPAAVQAQFTYTTSNDQITITGYSGTVSALIIPDRINGLPVTTIGDHAFASKTTLTFVTIPDSVTTIGSGAFGNCRGLTSVTIPYRVLIIRGGAFSGCTGLTNITIPYNVISMEDGVFYGCTGLTSVTIGNGVTSIGREAFYGCTGLTSVTIPDSVTTIGIDAFYGCTGLTSVTIGTGVTIIEDQAFIYCSSLTSVTIPKGLTAIGGYAFYGCTNLTAINAYAPNSAYSSVDGVLFNKSRTSLIQFPPGKAGSYTIPNSVTNIEDHAFVDCFGLTAINVDAPNSAYSSVDGVLSNKGRTSLIKCPGGKAGSYTVPNNVTVIGDYAFQSCSRLTSITIPNSATSIGMDTFRGCTGLTRVTIPNSVTNVGNDAFIGCTGLTSVTIGNRVTTFGSGAFLNCSGLKAVYFQGDAPRLRYGDEFEGVGSAIVYYLPGTTGWGQTLANFPTRLWNSLIQTGSVGFRVKAGQFGFNVTGTTGLSFVVEAATDLAQPVWTPVSTNTLAGGTASFSDPHWKDYPARLYRLRMP